MECSWVSLGEVVSSEKEAIAPEAGSIYWHYSLPAFDIGKGPLRELGSAIRSNKLVVHKGDILCNKLNMHFKRIWRIEEDLPNSICSTEFIPLRARGIDRNYLYYLLLTDDFTNAMIAQRSGTSNSHQRVRLDQLLSYQFALPSMDTQRRIADVLAVIDEKISLNSRINDHLEEFLDLIFKQALIDCSEWDEVSLLDIADYKNGLAMQKFRPGESDPGLPVLKIRELNQGYCGEDAERCRSNIDESVKVHDGDLVFSWSGTLLLDFWTGGSAGLNQHLFKVTSSSYPKWFYYMWTKHHMQRFVSLARDRATTMGHIKRSALAESLVRVPPKPEMRRLNDRCQPILDEILCRRIENRRLEQVRDALLPKLMSGEIDVSRINLKQLNGHLSAGSSEFWNKSNLAER